MRRGGKMVGAALAAAALAGPLPPAPAVGGAPAAAEAPVNQQRTAPPPPANAAVNVASLAMLMSSSMVTYDRRHPIWVARGKSSKRGRARWDYGR